MRGGLVMDIDGLWTVQFTSLREQYAGLTVEEEVYRGGVLVILNGHVLGGGISYYFVGESTLHGTIVEIDLRAIRYNDYVVGFFDAGAQVHMHARGTLQGDTMVLEAFMPGLANASIQIKATRREYADWTKV